MSLNDVYTKKFANNHNLEILNNVINKSMQSMMHETNRALRNWKDIEKGTGRDGYGWTPVEFEADKMKRKREYNLPLEGEPNISTLIQHRSKSVKVTLTLDMLCAIRNLLSPSGS